MKRVDLLAGLRWRKSSRSGGGSNGGGQCVEIAFAGDDRIAVRNSNYPDAGVLFFTRAELSAWIDGIKAGEFDHLAP